MVSLNKEYDRKPLGKVKTRIPTLNISKSIRNLLLLSIAGLVGLTFSGCRKEEKSNTADPAVSTSNTAAPKIDESLPVSNQNSKTVNEAPKTAIHFVDQTRESEVDFIHRADRSKKRLMPEIVGSGVLVGDFNRDGAPDLILINGGLVENPIRPADCQNRMFLNDGQGKFKDVTAEWGLPSASYGMGGAVGDFDNDGWPDLYLTTWGGGDMLLRNTGTGFQDVTKSAGIAADSSWKSSAAFFDANNDGWLDLYVVRYVDYDPATTLPSYFKGTLVYSTPVLASGLPDLVWINQGNGTFKPAPELPNSDQKSYEADWKGLAVGIADLNQDGLPDIYVANDTCRNLLFLNQGSNQFEEIARLSGAAYGDSGNEQAGMGVDFADVDGDGKWDIVCTNFQGEPANLFCQTGDMFFLDRTDSKGIGSATRNRLQWGCKFFDADNDGDMDLVIANGHLIDQIDSLVTGVTFGQPNSLFENDGLGKFRDISQFSGNAMTDAQVSRGLAVADFDGDGLVDYVVSNNGGTTQIARNASRTPGNFASFWLEGSNSNRSAIGARLIARFGDQEVLREVFGGTSFLSASDQRIHVGLGKSSKIEHLEIRWPSGLIQTLEQIEGNAFYHVREGQEPAKYVPGEAVIPPQQ